MPTTITKTVKSSGGDYSSLSAWEAAQQGNLVSLDEVHVGECYAFADTTAFTIDGSTTDATRYMKITVAAGNRHAGSYSTSAYRLEVSGSFAAPITISDDYCQIEWIQVKQTGGTANHYSYILINNLTGLLINKIIHAGGGAATSPNGACIGVASSAGTGTIRNSVLYKANGAGIYCNNFGGGTLDIQNCTIAGCGTYGIHNNSGTVTAVNCYSGGNTTDDYSGTITKTTCMHSSATVFTGSTASTAHSTANFTNVTAGSQDYHLVSGSALIDAGTDKSATYTDDIDGDTRSGTFDVGADEFVSVATGQPTRRRFGLCAHAAFPPTREGVRLF